MNNRRTFSVDTNSRFCLQMCTKSQKYSLQGQAETLDNQTDSPDH